MHTHIKENADQWKSQFPQHTELVDEILKSPNCGICLQKMMKALIATEDFGNQIRAVYGDDSLSGVINIQNQQRLKEVKEYTEEEWQQFYTSSNIQYQNVVLYFNPHSSKVVASYTGTLTDITPYKF
jgi:hypothetical protein